MVGRGVFFLSATFFQLVLSAKIFLDGGSDNSGESYPISLTTRSIGGNDEVIEKMGSIFARSDEVHKKSISDIEKTLTVSKAIDVVQSQHPNNTKLESIVQSLIAEGHIGKTALRKHKQPGGYSGVSGAKTLLNEMIYESLSKYDEEIAKCTEYYAKQCALMEVCRGSIAASNYVAANSRALILDAQANIGGCEIDIPKSKLQLKNHQTKCRNEITKMNKRLKIILGDIAVMTMILEMTDCEATNFLHMEKLALLRCENECTKESYVTFNHIPLGERLSQLKSKPAKELIWRSFQDFFIDSGEAQPTLLVQEDGSDFQTPITEDPKEDTAKFNKPPKPRVIVPGNPCNDPNAGAPSASTKRAAKCSIKKSPQCYKLQERFLFIQGGIADQRDQLLEEISMLETTCDETTRTLQAQISTDEDLLASSQTKLATATEKEASASESARQTALQNEQLNQDLVKQMKLCNDHYIAFETEACALRKIRGELYLLKGSGHSGFFQDCELSKWAPEECTKKCAGGEQKLIRSVLTHPDGGSACLPLVAVRSCNNGPCPVDCQLHAWTGWAKCSAECGGGVTQRVRDVKTAMKYGGKPCGGTSQTKGCNIQACEKDCELTDWTTWTICSKDCDGGTKRRQRFIKSKAEGSGTCPDEWSKNRLEYEPCNQHVCKVDAPAKVLPCNRSFDITLLVDTCPKTGEVGFKYQIQLINNFIDAFSYVDKTAFAVVQYCGPKTWSGVSKCTGHNGDQISNTDICKVNIAQHFTKDRAKLRGIINGLQYTGGAKLLELALLSAKSEMALSRKGTRSIVICFIDGPVLSPRRVELAARNLRKGARLMIVTVTKYTPLEPIKMWATRRWQENMVVEQTANRWKNPDIATHMVADICPENDIKNSIDDRVIKQMTSSFE
jgi:hypothetical protein